MSEIRIPDITSLDELKRADDGQYAHPIIACSPKVQGFAICTRYGKCRTCPNALAYQNPDIPFYIFKGMEDE